MRATWKPHTKHGDLTERADLPDSVFAYPKKRKEPMTDASHVRNAIARFDQVTGVTAAERELAFANIKKAAKHYKVDMTESSAGGPRNAAEHREDGGRSQEVGQVKPRRRASVKPREAQQEGSVRRYAQAVRLV